MDRHGIINAALVIAAFQGFGIENVRAEIDNHHLGGYTVRLFSGEDSEPFTTIERICFGLEDEDVRLAVA